MFTFLKKALSKTTSFFTKRLSNLFSKPLNEEAKWMLEEILYEADLGSSVVDFFMEKISIFAKNHPEATKEAYLD